MTPAAPGSVHTGSVTRCIRVPRSRGQKLRGVRNFVYCCGRVENTSCVRNGVLIVVTITGREGGVLRVNTHGNKRTHARL